MSNIYIQEPPTHGKVLLNTTVGDIDVELWSKETPKACRNFVQLCLEGYYNGTIFHRVVKGFIVQGGDPHGDGTGGESIYGQPFKDEFHSRLRFVRRGLVAMANSGKDDNASQFFFTLGPAPELQNKNTIFGQVTGNTLYNMLKLEETLVDHDDRPLYPHKIINTKVLLNPFKDIIPRVLKPSVEEIVEVKPKEKVKKNFSLLSFGDEAEEDEAETNAVSEAFKGQSKSSHDLTNDPKLSSVPAVDFDKGSNFEKESDPKLLDSIRKKLKKTSEDKVSKIKEKVTDDIISEDKAETSKQEKTANKIKEIRKEIKKLKKELKPKLPTEADSGIEKNEDEDKEKHLDNPVLDEYHNKLSEYKLKSQAIPQDKEKREKQTFELLKNFQNSLRTAKEKFPDDDNIDNSDDDNDQSWLIHTFRAEDEKIVVAKDANIRTAESYDISDPRNPINQRRRKEHKKLKK